MQITNFFPSFNRAASPRIYTRAPSFCHLRLTVPSLRYLAFISLLHISVCMVWRRNIPPAEHAVLSSPAAPPLAPVLESRSPEALSPLLQVRTAGTLRRRQYAATMTTAVTTAVAAFSPRAKEERDISVPLHGHPAHTTGHDLYTHTQRAVYFGAASGCRTARARTLCMRWSAKSPSALPNDAEHFDRAHTAMLPAMSLGCRGVIRD